MQWQEIWMKFSTFKLSVLSLHNLLFVLYVTSINSSWLKLLRGPQMFAPSKFLACPYYPSAINTEVQSDSVQQILPNLPSIILLKPYFPQTLCWTYSLHQPVVPWVFKAVSLTWVEKAASGSQVKHHRGALQSGEITLSSHISRQIHPWHISLWHKVPLYSLEQILKSPVVIQAKVHPSSQHHGVISIAGRGQSWRVS